MGGAVLLLSHDGVHCCWREDVRFVVRSVVGFVVGFVVELVVGFDVGKYVFFGYALGLKVGLPPSKNESDVREQAIGGRERSGSKGLGSK